MAQARETGDLTKGRCKWFNVVKGYGFITPHDGSPDVFLHQTVIKMQGFRSLAEGEEVEFASKESDKGPEATFVCGPGREDCKGTDLRPMSKKKQKKLRCYNCGDLSDHIAAKCPKGPMPKRCHICKSNDHLVVVCPQRSETSQKPDEPRMTEAQRKAESGAAAATRQAAASSDPQKSGGKKKKVPTATLR